MAKRWHYKYLPKLANIFENKDFWKCLLSLAPPGNPTNRTTGQADLYVDTTTDNLLELEHAGLKKLSR